MAFRIIWGEAEAEPLFCVFCAFSRLFSFPPITNHQSPFTSPLPHLRLNSFLCVFAALREIFLRLYSCAFAVPYSRAFAVVRYSA
jgi:hypothetical protein